MKQYPVITISRQYGSGGKAIAQALSQKLGIPYYDSELVNRAAEKSGFPPDLFKNADHNAMNSLLFSLAMNSTPVQLERPLGEQVFLIQSNILKEVAQEGPCILLGRCANYVLRDRPDLFSVFLRAPVEWRIRHATEFYQIDQKTAATQVTNQDKRRTNYYNYFTGEKWGRSEHYHMVLDTSRLGIDGTVVLLSAMAEQLASESHIRKDPAT